MTFERFTEKIFLIAAIISASITVLIFGFMVILGLPLFKGGLFFDLLTSPWLPGKGIYGIYPMIVGTLSIAFISLIFAFPLSLGCSAFLSVIGDRRSSGFIKKIVQFMTGIPTVIYGFVGVLLIVPIIRESFISGSGMCILAAGVVLSVVISPTMILIFSESFDQVPHSFLSAVDALGGSRVQKLLYVILPYSKRGILTGVILAFGRAVGDTLIALMIAGNAVSVPDSLLDSARTLTSHIALVIAADFDSMEFKTIFACGIVLYVFTAATILAVRLISLISRRQK